MKNSCTTTIRRLIVSILISIVAVCQIGNAMPFNHAPEGGPASLELAMVKLYEAAAVDINKLAGRAIAELNANPDRRASQFREIRAAQLTHQIQEKLDRLGSQSKVLIEGPLKNSVNAAIARGDEELAKIGLPLNPATPGSGVSFGLVNNIAVEVIAEDTIARTSSEIVDSLDAGIASHKTNAVEIFRTLGQSTLTTDNPAAEAQVNQAIAGGLITGNPIIADRAIRELFADNSDEVKRVRKLGNKQIVVGKATMSVRQYAATVTRTRMREATVEARHRRIQSRGINLVQITGRNSANFCTAFLGLVCSIGPAPVVPGLNVVALSSLPGGGPPFHPNCSKGTTPYIHELVSGARIASGQRAHEVYQKRLASGGLLKPVK